MSTTILEAKKHLRNRYLHETGFVGVGITQQNNEEALRVYVADAQSPVVKALKSLNKGRFEGFPVLMEVSGEVRAL